MAFWSDASAEMEPLRNFRFEVVISGGKFDTSLYAKKCSKPSFTVQETSHKWMNHTFYYPGRTEWNTITMSLVATKANNQSLNIMEMLRSSGYEIPKSNGRATMSKASAAAQLGSVTIKTLAADGSTVLETWTLKNAFIKDVKFGELDYESDDLTQIDIEFRYDYAECK